MIKKPPSLGQTLILAGFVLSCLGLLLFLWLSFGGATPLRPESYRIYIPFDEGTQLADQADVRISGVPVGHVVRTDLEPTTGLAEAEVSIDPEYAPIPEDTRAVLRAKTLLGETYVELSQGDEEKGHLPEGGKLPEAQVEDVVQLDEITRAFDDETRAAFQTWMIDSAQAIGGNGSSLSASIAHLDRFFSGFDQVFRVIDSQEKAVGRFFADGATTFDALSRRRGELSGLIREANQLAGTTADRDQAIIDAFHAWPTFLEESEATLARLREFSEDTDPLVRQLIPAAEELSPTLIELGRLAPEADRFLQGLDPVIRRANTAFPAARRLFREKLPPLLQSLDERFLPELNPLMEVVRTYRHDLTALVGNAAAATNAATPNPAGRGPAVKYLRALPSLGPESFATYPGRTANNRSNAYSDPFGYSRLAQGLLSYETRACGPAGINAALDPNSPNDPAFNDRTGGDLADAQDLFDRIQKYGFSGASDTGSTPAPGCGKQPKIDPFGRSGPATDYPQAYRSP